MKTHLIVYRLDRDFCRHQKAANAPLPFVPMAACHVKYSVMAQLKVKPRDITCGKCRRQAIRDERFHRWFHSPAGKRWQQREDLWK